MKINWNLARILTFLVLFIFIASACQSPNTKNQTREGSNTQKQVIKTQKINLYYPKHAIGTEKANCSDVEVYPVERDVPISDYMERIAIEELIKGPTQDETDEEYESALNAQTSIISMEKEGDMHTVEFKMDIGADNDNPCRFEIFREQVLSTLRQFPGNTDVIIKTQE